MGDLSGGGIYNGTISGGSLWVNGTTTASTIIVGNDYGNLGLSGRYADGQAYDTAAPSKPKPETNMDWLDKRVNEMRVSL